MTVRGVVFDMDGTLVDSRLDYDRIRTDLGLGDDEWILESIARLAPGPERERCLEVLRRHEEAGAAAATLMPRVRDLLDAIEQRGLHRAILTRNSRDATHAVLTRLGLEFAPIVTREDAPPKPDPEGLLGICRDWGIEPPDVLFIGDYLFDLETGQRAGVRTVLYAPDVVPPYAELADHVIRDFSEALPLIE